MKLKVDSVNSVAILYIVLFVAFIYGWVSNIVNIFKYDSFELTGVLILQIIGIFIAPLGAIMGYLV